MKPGFYELRQRRPVWEALSELARPHAGGVAVPVAELEEILITEVYPICRTKLWRVAGVGTDADQFGAGSSLACPQYHHLHRDQAHSRLTSATAPQSALAASSGWRLRQPAADRHAARYASRDLCSGARHSAPCALVGTPDPPAAAFPPAGVAWTQPRAAHGPPLKRMGSDEAWDRGVPATTRASDPYSRWQGSRSFTEKSS